MNKKLGKIRQLIARTLGIESKFTLAENGHLDIKEEELIRIREEYGEDFVGKFEKLLSEEKEDNHLNNNQIQSEMPKMLTLALICAALGVKELQSADDGSVSLNEEQLNKLEAELKKLQDEKAAAESKEAAANTAKDTAEKALSDAVTAMDDLDATVKEAKTPAEKVEAIRTKLAAKPAVIPAQNLGEDGKSEQRIEGNDEVNNYIKSNF
ncbi:MAG TPA: hypothetical protein PKI15_03930 [Candidatus Cloacimonadota bacterium]|nr:hypothetical protein [Candidatus Cloacimonadota bacterium]